MLPNRALIVCETPEEARNLLDFLSDSGARWGNPEYDDGEGSAMYYPSCEYGERTGYMLCYNLTDNYVGYCSAEWYHSIGERAHWENQDDPTWNYISAPDFIRRCGGSYQDELQICLEELL